MLRQCATPGCSGTFEVAGPAAQRIHCDVCRGDAQKRTPRPVRARLPLQLVENARRAAAFLEPAPPEVDIDDPEEPEEEPPFWRRPFLDRVAQRRSRLVKLEDEG